ncbi:hypothetical protein N864_01535 [Intrasporangium chromatireducens Q5-1]|uniref:Uncharacterized protein n=1 Tax=Intrasporangium chromatireducens Q5-1 TaxID=584657 RepID=W9GF03_9MICO|nr:hypothetical protein [Intrasporangium chromatireducens]EWT04791.1 hypothetical protein N864_01535 [Intrasporangium chromatireducens Q5-1]
MQALEQGPPPPPRPRRVSYGVIALVAFGVFLVLNFWPGWEALPIFTDRMTYTLGAVDFALWAVIAFNVAFLFSDARGLHLTAHLIIAMMSMFALTRLMRDFPFPLTGIWAGVVHWILVLGTVLSFLVIPATWWGMVTQGYDGPGAKRGRRGLPGLRGRHLGRHRHAS